MTKNCIETGCDQTVCAEALQSDGELCQRHWDMAGDDNAVTDGHITCHEFFVKWDEESVYCGHDEGYHALRVKKAEALAKARAAKKAKAQSANHKARTNAVKAKKSAEDIRAAKVAGLAKARAAKAAKREQEQAMMARATADHKAKKAAALEGMKKAASVASQVLTDTPAQNSVTLTLSASEAAILKALLEREQKAAIGRSDKASFTEARVLETRLMDAIYFAK